MMGKGLHAIMGICLCCTLIGCTVVDTKMIRITPAVGSKPVPPMQALRCAAQQNGWTITFNDEQNLSGTKQVGTERHGVVSLNVALQPSEGSTDPKATVTVNHPGGFADLRVREYIETVARCGAAASIVSTGNP